MRFSLGQSVVPARARHPLSQSEIKQSCSSALKGRKMKTKRMAAREGTLVKMLPICNLPLETSLTVCRLTCLFVRLKMKRETEPAELIVSGILAAQRITHGGAPPSPPAHSQPPRFLFLSVQCGFTERRCRVPKHKGCFMKCDSLPEACASR